MKARVHVQPCPYCSNPFAMESMTHTDGDLVLCPTCGCALRYRYVEQLYKRMSVADWLVLTTEEQHDLIKTRRTLALEHVMVDDWRYEYSK